MRIRIFAAAVAAILLATPTAAHELTVGTIEITDLWTRATPPGAQAAGGFLTLTNTGTEPDRLIAVSTPVAARGELHEMAVNDGVMTMRQVEAIEIPPGETVTLAPGGFHLMFIGMSEPLSEGGVVPVTLTFEAGGAIETYLHVVGVGAMAPEGAHGGNHGEH